MTPEKKVKIPDDDTTKKVMEDFLTDIDFVPPNIKKSQGRVKLVIFEDNEAVIKTTIKGRSPNMRHITRTHRIDLDWIFERLRDDEGMQIKYVGTKQQMADFLTKGAFTAEQWRHLCDLAQIGKAGIKIEKPVTTKETPPSSPSTPVSKPVNWSSLGAPMATLYCARKIISRSCETENCCMEKRGRKPMARDK